MINALKIISLPSLFILPWLLVMLSKAETSVQKALASQPLLVGALLLPGGILSIVWLINQLKNKA